jgi:hypothetical protein
MSPPSLPVTSSFSMDGAVIIVGLVLLALAAIFRRGSVLEDEHAHVVQPPAEVSMLLPIPVAACCSLHVVPPVQLMAPRAESHTCY